MIQRAQTVYFFIAILALIPAFVWEVFTLEATENSMELVYSVFGFQGEGAEFGMKYIDLFIPYSVIGVLILVAIFLFKNRKLQLKLGQSLYYLLILTFIYQMFMVELNESEIGAYFQSSFKIVRNWSYYAPVVAVVMLFLANRGIRKDEALVKSLDRLR